MRKSELRVKNKHGFIDGTISKLNDDDGGKWQSCNDLVRLWVLNSILCELVGSLCMHNLLEKYGRICKNVFSKLMHQKFINSNKPSLI